MQFWRPGWLDGLPATTERWSWSKDLCVTGLQTWLKTTRIRAELHCSGATGKLQCGLFPPFPTGWQRAAVGQASPGASCGNASLSQLHWRAALRSWHLCLWAYLSSVPGNSRACHSSLHRGNRACTDSKGFCARRAVATGTERGAPARGERGPWAGRGGLGAGGGAGIAGRTGSILRCGCGERPEAPQVPIRWGGWGGGRSPSPQPRRLRSHRPGVRPQPRLCSDIARGLGRSPGVWMELRATLPEPRPPAVRGSAGVRLREVPPAPGSRTPGGSCPGAAERGRAPVASGEVGTGTPGHLPPPAAPPRRRVRRAGLRLWGREEPGRCVTALSRAGQRQAGPLKAAGGARCRRGCGAVPAGCGAGRSRRSSRHRETSRCLPAGLPPNARSAARPPMFHRGPVPQLTHTRPPAQPAPCPSADSEGKRQSDGKKICCCFGYKSSYDRATVQLEDACPKFKVHFFSPSLKVS